MELENLSRVINLHDDYTDYLAVTDAPREIIEEAIEYKNEMLVRDDPLFRSDFEEMQEYVRARGYNLEEIGYAQDFDTYYW